MRGPLVIITGCLVIAIACVALAGADEPYVEIRAAVDSVTVGQRLVISYAATYPDSLTLLPPRQFDPGNCHLVSVRWHEERLREGQRIKQADVVVLPMDLETAAIPPASFSFLSPSGDTLVVFSDAVEIPVRTLTTAESETKPLKPQWQAPRRILPYVLAGAGLLALAAVAIWLWKRRRRAEPDAEPVVPELPADYVALKALAEIEAMGLAEKGHYKKYYTLVVDVLRHYLERRYVVATMDRTTDEILHELDLGGRKVDDLEELLREADLVKFAKHKPEEARATLKTARDIVVNTTPRPVVAVEGE